MSWNKTKASQGILSHVHPTRAEAHNSLREVPYSPSFVLDLVADVDPNLRNVVDFVFLPGYHNPTIAVLCQSEKTWAG